MEQILSDVGERLPTFCELVSHTLSNYYFFGMSSRGKHEVMNEVLCQGKGSQGWVSEKAADRPGAAMFSRCVRESRGAVLKLSGGRGTEHRSGSGKRGCSYRFGPRTLRQTIASSLMSSSPTG